MVDHWHSCPFHFYFSTLLGAGEDDFQNFDLEVLLQHKGGKDLVFMDEFAGAAAAAAASASAAGGSGMGAGAGGNGSGGAAGGSAVAAAAFASSNSTTTNKQSSSSTSRFASSNMASNGMTL